MDLYYIYLKQDTFVCGSEMRLWNVFLFMDLFDIFTYRYPFMCIEMYLWEELFIYKSQNTFVNPSLCIHY